ncbi:cation diffusion facilitator family transporter [Sphingomonas sp. 22R3R2A-7]|uniref:cation diffusion facilitator family transporter n=1 Tax=Sphingomonas sp. 22R3R2A-7 TaxID=3050230 RepID=UPI002FE3B17B
MGPPAERQEQRLLLLSAAGTLALALVGIAIGLLSGAKSIVFDGIYSLADAGLTLAAFAAARLIARGADRKFQYGYWHIEPMLGLVNGSVLLLACAYALADGADAMLAGGREVSFGPGIGYAGASAIICLSIYFFVRRRSRGLGSSLLELDSRAWLFSGILNAGLSFAFLIAILLNGTRAEQLAMYFDPAILILLALGMAPLPVRSLLAAGREILQIAPADLDAHVSRIAREVAARHGFIEHQSYVTRVGRAQFVEIGFVGASASTAMTLGALDSIRQEVADAMGGLRPGYWLTIDFTADSQWI